MYRKGFTDDVLNWLFANHHGPLALVLSLVVYAVFVYCRNLFLRQPPRIETSMDTKVDLAIAFRIGSGTLQKSIVREDAQKAEEQYSRLIATLKGAGLYAVGKRGESRDQVVILVYCPQSKLASLVQRERYSDFLYGLSTTNLASVGDSTTNAKLSASDRLRLIYSYITNTVEEGGLGVIPKTGQWDRVDTIIALHDHDFNHEWIKSWTTHDVGMRQLDAIRDQHGEAVALYFSFLRAYAAFLIFPSALGVGVYFYGEPYSAVYSSLLLVWAVTFVEWWRIRERLLALRWSTRGSFRVEKKRAAFVPDTTWWKRDVRMLASLPVILFFAGILATLLTSIFIFEAFITTLYTGPGHKYIGLAPTVLFMTMVPRLLGLYQSVAEKLTAWENHSHQSSYDGSLTVKIFSLSSIVAYLGLSLSAFVYVPFGADVMSFVHTSIFKHAAHPPVQAYTDAANATLAAGKSANRGLWEANAVNAHAKLNPSRLQDQMFAYTVTNQIIGTFLEVGLPFVLRAFASVRGKKAEQKRVEASDAASPADKDERALLHRVRHELSLPDYALFSDYAEMVTQFGYVVLWSTIWPLAPVMALANNMLELRSDAYKITVHMRRPLPMRTDTVGPWLESLASLAWLGALTNAALVYLFHPRAHAERRSTVLKQDHTITAAVAGAAPQTTRQLLVSAATIALLASHGFVLLRYTIRHVLERAMWRANPEVGRSDDADRRIKENYMKSLGVSIVDAPAEAVSQAVQAGQNDAFWAADEGLDQIRKDVKDA